MNFQHRFASFKFRKRNMDALFKSVRIILSYFAQ